MAGKETSIGAIRKRTTKLLADWGADFSVVLKELEETRARLQELEATAAGQSDEVEALNRRIEAQDALIASLHSEADEAATLLKASIIRYATTNSQLQQSVTTWKEKYAALKSSGPAAEPAIAPALPELGAEELRPLEIEEAFGGDDTVNIDMRESLREARQMTITKK